MNFVDPFSNDTARYKKLLNDDSPTLESMKKDDNVEYADAEEILSSHTVKGLSPEIFQETQKKIDDLKINKEQKQEVVKMFNTLFDDLNKKYNLDLHVDFDSFCGSLTSIIDPVKNRVMEMYLSEAYGRFRTIIYLKYLQAITLLSNQILDPKYLLSESMTYEQKLDILEKLYEFMDRMNSIYEKVHIDSVDLKLEKVSEDSRPTYDLNSSEVQDFMSSIFNNVKNNSNGLEQK